LVAVPSERLTGEAGGEARFATPTEPEPTPAPAAAGSEPGYGSVLSVRGVGPGDLPGLRGIDVLLRLNQPEALLVPYSPLRDGLAALLPGQRARRRVFVATVRTHLVGYAHFQPIPPDQRWLLVALGTTQIVAEPGTIWEAMLRHAIVVAGRQGVKRLYARAPAGAPAAPALRAVGFTPYATETIFAAHELEPPTAGGRVRAQEAADTWAIHQLYNAAVPRQVQYAEAFTSHRWELGGARGERRGVQVTGWLLESGHLVLGYARITTRGEHHLLDLVYHPERIEAVAPLVDAALARLPRRGNRVYCAVRGYQAEAATVLQERGFIPVLEQDLHVKYTTVNVRLPAGEVVPFRVEVRDRLPKRVPSLLHGRPQDETVT